MIMVRNTEYDYEDIGINTAHDFKFLAVIFVNQSGSLFTQDIF